MQVVDMKLGAEGEAKVDLVGGVLVLSVDEKTAGLDGGLQVSVPLTYFLDALVLKANNAFVTGVVKVLEGILVSLP